MSQNCSFRIAVGLSAGIPTIWLPAGKTLIFPQNRVAVFSVVESTRYESIFFLIFSVTLLWTWKKDDEIFSQICPSYTCYPQGNLPLSIYFSYQWTASVTILGLQRFEARPVQRLLSLSGMSWKIHRVIKKIL